MVTTLQVNRATAEEQLDSERVSLTVDQRGVVLAASTSPRSLFGFDPPADLVGQPLAAFVNMFEEFRVQQQTQAGQQRRTGSGQGSRGSHSPSTVQEQYSRLALQIGPGPEQGSSSVATVAKSDDSMLLMLLARAAQEGSEACYRVGVRSNPLASDQIGKSTDQQRQQEAAGLSKLLAALGGHGSNKLRAAVMRIDVLETDWTKEADSRDVKFQV